LPGTSCPRAGQVSRRAGGSCGTPGAVARKGQAAASCRPQPGQQLRGFVLDSGNRVAREVYGFVVAHEVLLGVSERLAQSGEAAGRDAAGVVQNAGHAQQVDRQRVFVVVVNARRLEPSARGFLQPPVKFRGGLGRVVGARVTRCALRGLSLGVGAPGVAELSLSARRGTHNRRRAPARHAAAADFAPCPISHVAQNSPTVTALA
ncbi:hypothetical protein U6M85_12260, partial [Cutibacterium acnes]